VAGHISFGKRCIVGPSVMGRFSNHISSDLNKSGIYQWLEIGCIRIGNNVWIDSGEIILPCIKIGDGVIVRAWHVVTKSSPANQAIGGVYAKSIKERRL
jgi:acetyltransferase-like isoleucine patch superfamily enzyme